MNKILWTIKLNLLDIAEVSNAEIFAVEEFGFKN